LPEGWKMSSPQKWGDHETTVYMQADKSEAIPALYFKVLAEARKLSPEEMRAQHRADCESKAKSRLENGVTGYRLRPDSIQYRTINGREAASCTAEYTQNGREMVEYFVRVRSEKVSAMFFARLPAAELDQFHERFDKVVDTLRIPE